VSLLVEVAVVGVLALSVSPGWDDGIAALVDDVLEEPGGVVGLVGDDVFGSHAVNQLAGGRPVVLLAWPEDEADRQAERVYTDVELGSEAAARAGKRLGVLSPFLRGAPAAWAWARMTVASSITHSRSGSAPTASKIRFSTPISIQR